MFDPALTFPKACLDWFTRGASAQNPKPEPRRIPAILSAAVSDDSAARWRHDNAIAEFLGPTASLRSRKRMLAGGQWDELRV